jgi:hypothetical protein
MTLRRWPAAAGREDPRPSCAPAFLLILALLASCGGGGPAPLPTDRIRAFFPAGGVADAIEVDAVNRLALRRAELVAPDGRTAATGSIVAQPAPVSATAVALPSGSYFAVGALAAGGGNPPNRGPVGGVQTESRLLATVSQATIALPDPTAYRRDWRKYRIRLHFGAPPDTETREMAAPAPAPARSLP